MADTVVKNQREQELVVERQLLREVEERERREKEEEEKRKMIMVEKKKQMREALLQQLQYQTQMKEIERKQNQAFMKEWTQNVEGEASKRKRLEE